MTQEVWPPLPFEAWRDTCATLHMWTQIVGKTRLALAPMENHWWQVALYVTPRGLTTSGIPAGARTFAVDFDFLDHKLRILTSDNAVRELALTPGPVADFYAEYLAALRSLALEVRIRPIPSEVETAIAFPEDRVHASYDAAAANRFWRVLVQTDRVSKRFRGRFLGKASPVHLFWGGLDMAATRFSGRRAPPHPGGIPNLPDRITREAYSHECSSSGFWPGAEAMPEAVFYAYAYPEPDGYRENPVTPSAAHYHEGLREFILPYEAVRTASSPDQALLDFFQSTYDAAADHGRWDRAALERPRSEWP